MNNDAILELKPSHSRVDIPALTFLLSTVARDTVMEISTLDAKFQICVDAINMRSLVHREQYQPALDAAVKKTKTQRLLGHIVEREIGDMLTITMKRATDDVYELVSEAIKQLEVAGPSLQGHFKKVFPKHTIVKFEPLKRTEPPALQENSDREAPNFGQRPLYRNTI